MIELRNFNAFYNQKQVLYELSTMFKSGQITALIGPSGSGKTTLLKAVNRTAEISPDFHCQGDVVVAGEAVYSVKHVATVRRKIGMVLQKPLALPLSIKENIVFGPRYYGVNKKTELDILTETILQRVGLWEEVKDRLSSPAQSLSGGQLQRLSIGRSLAINPTVLLLDEPCSSLDIKATKRIEELLVELSEQLTIVIVTHNLGQAKRIAAETVFLSEGRIVEHSSTERIFQQPEHQLTQEFLAF